MEGGDGMVTVVRGLRNARLTVTLVDGCRRYYLVPDSGSICAGPQLYEPESINNSLRNCPQLPQSSSKTEEKIVNYTKTNHSPSKGSPRSQASPTSLFCNGNYTLDMESKSLPTRHRHYESRVNKRPRMTIDESPTRERRPKTRDISPESNTTPFYRNLEVRFIQDYSKRSQNSLRNLAGLNKTSVNMEIQAVIETISREVATSPRVETSKRNVAVPLSPISSTTQLVTESPLAASLIVSVIKSVQTIQTNISAQPRKSIHATTSFVELPSVVNRWQYIERRKIKSKSQEEVRTRKDELRKQVIHLLESMDCDSNEDCQAFRDELIRKMKKNSRRIYFDIDIRTNSAPFWFKPNCRNFIDRYRIPKPIKVFKARSHGLHNEDKPKRNRLRLRKENLKNKTWESFPLKTFIQPTEKEMRDLVREELLVFMKKIHLKLNLRDICNETEVISVLIDSIEKLQWGDYDKVVKGVAKILRETSKIPEHYFSCLSENLIKSFKHFMRHFNTHNMKKVERQTFFVFQNSVQNTPNQTKHIEDIEAQPVTEADVEANIERYSSQLTQLIEAWWMSIIGDDENEKGFREVAINDLAGDIVDRLRFLGMERFKHLSEADEVEYLKYQIFRWINKLVGDEALQQALNRAPDLMKQIQKIPVPIMTIPVDVSRAKTLVERPRSPAPAPDNTPAKTPPVKLKNVQGENESFSVRSKKHGATGRKMSDPTAYSSRIPIPNPARAGCSNNSPRGRRYSSPENFGNLTRNPNTIIPSISKITEEFWSFINDCVSQIPIAENSAQEQNVAKKLRQNIYNGILDVFTNIEMNPTKFRNEFYLQDFLEKELDQLLSSIPSTSDLTSKLQILKSKIIKSAIDTIKAIRVANTSTSFKYRLWDAITSFLPPRIIVDDKDKSIPHLQEEFLKLNIAEDYLLFMLYLHMNTSKEEAYLNKIQNSILKLYDNAKLLPDSDRLPANQYDFREQLLRCMVNVKAPPRDLVQDEADQIDLGREIFQWMQDLPIVHSDAHVDQLQTRRLRDSLAKKIHDIEKQTNLCDNSAVRLMKNEISNFLEKFTVRPEELGNITFLIDEFINRLKNRREKVEKPISFPMFIKQMPFSSSIIDRSGIVIIEESIEDQWAHFGPPPIQNPRSLGADLMPKVSPYKEPTNVEWLTLLNTQEQQRQMEARAAAGQSTPPCCQPNTTPNLRPQFMNNHLNQNEQLSYKEPSKVKWLTMLNTQERIEREKEDLEAQRQSQQIPPCCQSGALINQRDYNTMRPGVGGSAALPSSFIQPPHQTSIMPTISGRVDPSEIPRPMLAGSSNSDLQNTPMIQRPVRPRRIGSPQQIMSSINQSQDPAQTPRQEAIFGRIRHGVEEIPEQNVSRPMISPHELSMQVPVGFSTPRQSLEGRGGPPGIIGAENVPGAPRVKRARKREGNSMHRVAARPEAARRRLDLEQVEEEEEKDGDEMQCNCTEHVYRCRPRRPMCCDCQDMDYLRYYPMPYPYHFF